MILTAHQPVYLPWLGLFHKISLADTYCFFDDVQFETRGWANRNYIKGANNKTLLTVPVLSKGHREKKYTDIRINNEINWQRKHWKSICVSYSKAQFFDLYADKLTFFYEKKWDFISDLNYEMLIFFMDKLQIKTKTVKMSDHNFKGRKSDLVLDMCLELDADTYIFGEQGKNYANSSSFQKRGIGVKYQEYIHPEYRQLSSPFTPFLSIIDLLFNCGEESSNIISQNNVGKKNLSEEEKSS
jgi:hypothetical protein